MTTALHLVAALVALAGLVVALLILLDTRRVDMTLGVFLDLLVAAGLLRLAAASSWTAIIGAGGIVLIRQIVMLAFRRGGRALGGWHPLISRDARSESSS
jgi:hypothetical protein